MVAYKQQMVRFINGEHSTPPLSPRAILWTWVLFASSVAQTGFLPPQAPGPEVCTHNHFPCPPFCFTPGNPFLMLTIAWFPRAITLQGLNHTSWHWTHFSAPGFSLFLPPRLTPWLWLNYWFNRHGFLFPSSPVSPCPSVVVLSSSRGVNDRRVTC